LVLNGNLVSFVSFEGESGEIGKIPLKSFKSVFLALPSVKHLKKYEKGGFSKGLYKYVWHGRVTV